MSLDHTQQQSFEEQQQAQALSLRGTRPPANLPGYELHRFLGAGAYGEVWVGTDQNTGRRVAVKFYTHCGGGDWLLLAREVERLVQLSADRHVVQLLDVGWQAEPRYYVMEYVENGSLQDFIDRRGALPAREASDLFGEIAVGLMHAHGKGVLHCDLKPANILLDQDRQPRLADFGQSRLSNEQKPALGTLFYMAPEQADLRAIPDARWDVYALGAIFHCMLTGHPPYREEVSTSGLNTAADLSERLERYRKLLRTSPRPGGHWRIPGVDRALAEIIDGCLAIEPKERFPSAQAVVAALRAREQARARRPLLVLGLLGPLLLLAIMASFGVSSFRQAQRKSAEAVKAKALEFDRFAAKAVAGNAAYEIDRYFHAVERTAESERLQELLQAFYLEQGESRAFLETLADPDQNDKPLPEREKLLEHPRRLELQSLVEDWLRDGRQPKAASWFVVDRNGTQLAAVYDVATPGKTLLRNWGWRTYFHGGPDDLEIHDGHTTRYLPAPDHIRETHLSAPFLSRATNTWKIAVSSPVYLGGERHEENFLGVIAMTIDVGMLVRFEAVNRDRFAVLVYGRPGKLAGMVLQHPLFDRLLLREQKLPAEIAVSKVPPEAFEKEGLSSYQDPLGQFDPDYRGEWLVASQPVFRETGGEARRRQRVETGLIVLVQEDSLAATAEVSHLGEHLLGQGVLALTVVVIVIAVLWFIVLRVLGAPGGPRRDITSSDNSPSSIHVLETLTAPYLGDEPRP